MAVFYYLHMLSKTSPTPLHPSLMNKKNIHLLVLPSAKNIARVVNKLSFDAILTKGSYRDIEFIFQKNQIRVLHDKKDVKYFSFVWLSSFWSTRDLAYAVKLYLKKYNIPHTYIEKSTSKITDQMTFSLKGIRTPDTLFVDSSNIKNNLRRIREVCGYPFIVKDVRGSLGANSLLINREEDVLETVQQLPKHKKYFFNDSFLMIMTGEFSWLMER